MSLSAGLCCFLSVSILNVSLQNMLVTLLHDLMSQGEKYKEYRGWCFLGKGLLNLAQGLFHLSIHITIVRRLSVPNLSVGRYVWWWLFGHHVSAATVCHILAEIGFSIVFLDNLMSKYIYHNQLLNIVHALKIQTDDQKYLTVLKAKKMSLVH